MDKKRLKYLSFMGVGAFFLFSTAVRCGVERDVETPLPQDFGNYSQWDFNGKWTKGLVSEVNSNVYIEIDSQKKELYYSYSINDCFTSFDVNGKLKSPAEKDSNLNFYVTDWEGMVKKDNRVEFYGKIRFGKYKHGVLGETHDHGLITPDKQITIRDTIENAKIKPSIPSQILDKPPASDAIYAFVSIKKLSQNTYDVFLWGGPDVTANASVYDAYVPKKTNPDGSITPEHLASAEYLAEKAKFPLAKDSTCHTVFLIQKAWVGFSDTPAVLSKVTYEATNEDIKNGVEGLKDLALKYGKTTYGVYTRVKE